MFQANHHRNSVGQPLMATIGVVDIEVAQAAYCEMLEYQCVSDTTVSADYAALWGDAHLIGRALRILQPKSGVPVFIRLIEADVQPDRGCFSSINPWFAIELCVQDSARLYEQLLGNGYFEPFAPPAKLSFTDQIFPFQCRGANGEILYLNETRGNLPDVDLPLATSFVDHIFIAILSASSLEKTTTYYKDLLNLGLQETHEFPYKTINRVFDLPLDTMHKLNTIGTGRNVFFEIDQTPAIARKSLTSKGVHRGICCMSFRKVADRVAMHEPCRDAPYNGAEISQTFGLDGERIELVSF